MNFQTFPKIELHLHLDCSLSYQAIHQLDPSVTEEIYQRDFVAPGKCTNLVDYLTRAPREVALMQTEDQLRLAVEDVFEQLRRDHHLYAELRFAPILHTEQGLSPYEVVRIVEEAAAQASQRTGVMARLILCTLRHYSEEQSLETARLVEQFRGTLVAALDIAGDEAGQPLAPHIPAFQYAHAHNLFCTAHAGEASGPHSVWETLQHLAPSRIGHGARSSEDPELVEYLKAHAIHLEICPTSNVQTDICDTYADHPIHSLYTQGVLLNVNTDARTVTPITLSEEYSRLAHTFDWGYEQFVQTNLNAINAAFLAEPEKQELRQRFEARLAEQH
ncbi:adenosine deaminase [Tengunoibacter tsumagoiensis]|uniref:adenosine deaminase n=1 Tax=Tengunoibacter tsumagoiensis TaxID=2014871 RepID=A0A401ZYF1_9CHLR|nr:adenosine deaminase [Tengunoibacter tsumagoiensis]GCE11867.1 adenosine deaminase [Tengunoibacter tsumagoiensis]